MTKRDIVHAILANVRPHAHMYKTLGVAFAPANIALCKYWGKRDEILNLPFTSSISLSLGDKGASTLVAPNVLKAHRVSLNGQPVDDSGGPWILFMISIPA